LSGIVKLRDSVGQGESVEPSGPDEVLAVAWDLFPLLELLLAMRD